MFFHNVLRKNSGIKYALFFVFLISFFASASGASGFLEVNKLFAISATSSALSSDIVDYSNGSGSNTSTFNYTVVSGETSSDLDYISINSLVLNGGTILDAALNLGTLTLASPGDLNFSIANKDLIIDTTPPTVNSLTSNGSDLVVKDADTERITAVFNESMTSAPTISIDLASGTDISAATMTQGSNATTWYYDWNVPSGSDGSATSTVAGTDLAGNAYAGSTNLVLTIDNTAPAAFNVGSVITTGGTVEANYWNASNTGIDITVLLANDASLTDGTLQIRANVAGGGYEDLGSAHTILVGELNANKTLSFNAATFEGLSGGLSNLEAITFTAIITDKAANATTGTASATTITYDQAAPAAFNVGSVITTGGTVVAGQWNPTNSGIDITVPLANDNSLTDGTLQIRANVAGGGYEDLGSAHTILVGELNANKTLSFNAATFEGLSGGLSNLEAIAFTAIITDKAANATTGTASSTTITYDQAAPAAFNVGSVITTGGTVEANYWNASNTGIDITVPLANDASLTDGTLQIRANVAGGGYEDLGSAHTILVGELNANKTLSFNAAAFEGLSGGLSNLEAITFTAIITDKAGNATTGTASATTITYDELLPTLVSAVTGDNNADGTVDRLTLTFSEQVDLSSVDNNNFTLTESASGSSLAISGSYSSNNQTSVTLTLTGVTVNNTSLTIDPNYDDATGTIIDNAGNEMSFSETVTGTDGAAPALVSASYKDTETPIGNAQVDRIDAVFSETLTSSNYEGGDWTFPTNPASLTKSSGAISGNTVQITVTGSPANTTVLGTTTVKYTNPRNRQQHNRWYQSYGNYGECFHGY